MGPFEKRTAITYSFFFRPVVMFSSSWVCVTHRTGEVEAKLVCELISTVCVLLHYPSPRSTIDQASLTLFIKDIILMKANVVGGVGGKLERNLQKKDRLVTPQGKRRERQFFFYQPMALSVHNGMGLVLGHVLLYSVRY